MRVAFGLVKAFVFTCHRGMRKLILVAVWIGIAGPAYATGKFTYAPQKIALKGVRDIKIAGVKGTLKLKGHKSSRHLTLKVQHSRGRRLDDWHLSLERRGRTLFLEVFNVAYGKQWRNMVREDQWPEFDIEIDSPALPMDVAWREGRVDIVHWGGELDLSLLKGRISALGGTGALRLQPVEADVKVADYRGPVTIRGESGDLWFERVAGNVNINWFKGDLLFKNCQGNVQVEMESGRAVVEGLSGTLQAKGNTTKWDLSAAAPADVNVTTVDGPVKMAWKGGGAKVFLTTKRGKIGYPAKGFLRESDREGTRVVEGVKSAKAMGQVFVRTESGAITWR